MKLYRCLVTRRYTLYYKRFNKITEHSLEDISIALSEKIDTATNIDTLVNIATYAVKHDSVKAAALYSKTLVLSMERDNVPEKVVKIIMSLSELSQSIIKSAKDNFITSLHLGFMCTTSESILNAIVTVVRRHKWTRRFKKLLKDNTDKLDLFDKLAK